MQYSMKNKNTEPKKKPENKKSNVSKVLFKLNKAPIQLKDLMSTEYEVALAMSVFGYVV